MHSKTLRIASPGLSGLEALLITFSTSSSIAWRKTMKLNMDSKLMSPYRVSFTFSCLDFSVNRHLMCVCNSNTILVKMFNFYWSLVWETVYTVSPKRTDLDDNMTLTLDVKTEQNTIQTCKDFKRKHNGRMKPLTQPGIFPQVGTRWHKSLSTRMMITQDCSPLARAFRKDRGKKGPQ